jgi:hypothetical protein
MMRQAAYEAPVRISHEAGTAVEIVDAPNRSDLGMIKKD